MSAETAEHAGTPQSKLLVMENIKELRERNRAGSIDGAMLPDSQSDQVISLTLADGCNGSVHPGPGLKRQASSNKLREIQASSGKHQAPSTRVQAPSRKRQAPGPWTLEKVLRYSDQGPLL